MTDRKTYTPEGLQSILDLHRKWLYKEEGGIRADLRRADLSRADLSGADLRGAYLSGADLRGAYLTGADLRGVYLTDADLSRADLRSADLRSADLSRADLRGVYLTDADLSRADLSGADLRGAYLTGADLRDAKITDLDAARLSILPEGELVGWKKVEARDAEMRLLGRAIVKLRIPADAARSNGTGRKCRCSKAEVLDVEPLGDLPDGARFVSPWEYGFEYRVGDTVEPRYPFDHDRWEECASGIHFFITREEAMAWTL